MSFRTTTIRNSILGVLLVLGGFALAGCIPDSATLAGTLTSDQNGAPAQGIQVRVWDATTQAPVAGPVVSDDQGQYHFDDVDVPAGDYKVSFDTGTEVVWWPSAPDFASGATVTVTGSGTIMADASLTLAPYVVSGTVTDSGAAPVAGATVTVVDAAQKILAVTSTDTNGAYSAGGLTASEFGVRVSAPGRGTVHHGSTDGSFSSQARPASGGAATGVDVVSPLEATISGDVLIGSSYLGAENTTVLTYRKVAGSSSGIEFVSSVVADNSGSFQVHSLTPGDYTLVVIDSAGMLAPKVYGTSSLDIADGATVTTQEAQNSPVGDISVVGHQCNATDFPGTDHVGENLAGYKLAGCDLDSVDFTSADLTGADLRGAEVSQVVFTYADLTYADLSAVMYLNAYVNGKNTIADATLVGTNLEYPGFASSMTGLDLAYAPLMDASFAGMDLSGTDMTGADLTGALLASTSLDGVELADAILDYVVSGGIVGTPASLPDGWILDNGYLVQIGVAM